MQNEPRVVLKRDVQMNLFRYFKILAGGNRNVAAKYIGISNELLKHYETGRIKTVPEKAFYAMVDYIIKNSCIDDGSYRPLPISMSRISDKDYVSGVLRTYSAVVGSRSEASAGLQLNLSSFEEMIYGRRRLRLEEADRINTRFRDFDILNGIDLSNPESLISRKMTDRQARRYGVRMYHRRRASAENAGELNRAWRKNLTETLKKRYGKNWRTDIAELRLESIRKKYGNEYQQILAEASKLGVPIEEISEMGNRGIFDVLNLLESTPATAKKIAQQTGYAIGRVGNSVIRLQSGSFISRHGSRKWEITDRGRGLLKFYGNLKKVGRI